MSEYKLGNVSFSSEEEFETAKKELNTIQQIKAKYDVKDPKIAKAIYDKFVPKTKVGEVFQKQLKDVFYVDEALLASIDKELSSKKGSSKPSRAHNTSIQSKQGNTKGLIADIVAIVALVSLIFASVFIILEQIGKFFIFFIFGIIFAIISLVISLISLKGHRKYKSLKRTITGFIITAVAFSLMYFCLSYLIRYHRVFPINSENMDPIMTYDDSVIASVEGFDIKNGDICIVCSPKTNNISMAQRVIGIPGDNIDIDEYGKIYVNGVKLDNISVPANYGFRDDTTVPCEVKNDCYFVINESEHYNIIVLGLVNEEEITGKILFRFKPFGKLGPIK